MQQRHLGPLKVGALALGCTRVHGHDLWVWGSP